MFSRIGTLHDTNVALVWSVLVIDVQEARVEALITALEGTGWWTEAILRDPDVDDLYFVQVSETRRHDVASFSQRADEVRALVRGHAATVADWSARDARLSNRA